MRNRACDADWHVAIPERQGVSRSSARRTHYMAIMNDRGAGFGLSFRLPLQRQGDTELLWSHYRLEHGDSQPLMEVEHLDDGVADAMVLANARPRASAIDGGLLVVLRGVNLNPGADPEDMVSVRLWPEADRVITVSPRLVTAVDDVRHRVVSNSPLRPQSPMQLLAILAMALVYHMGPVIDALDDEVEDLQERLLAGDSQDLYRSFSDVRHRVTLLRRHLAPQRDALARLNREAVAFATMEDRDDLREVGDRIIRYVEDLDSARERATLLQDELDHAVSMKLNKNMYVMSVIAAIFLPLSFLTGLLGINVGGVPGEKNDFAFWAVCAVMLVLAGVEFALLRSRRII